MSHRIDFLRPSLTGALALISIVLFACAASKSSDVPPGIDRSAVHKQTVEIKAKRYEFSPDVLRVKAGTLLQLKIESTEGTHGFSLSGFDVDVRVEENKPTVLEVYLPEKGEFGFRCSHFCGIGHLGMTGKIVVE